MSKIEQVHDKKKISQKNIIYQPKKNRNIPILSPFGIKNGISENLIAHNSIKRLYTPF